MVTKKAKVIMLPIEDKSNIILNQDMLVYFRINPIEKPKGTILHHLYFTTDDKIKIGDWAYDINDRYIFQMNNQTGIDLLKDNIKKIIATTDTSLRIEASYKKGLTIQNTTFLPQIPQSFIEKYCELGGIDEVLIEYENIVIPVSYNSNTKLGLQVKINPDNTINILPIKNSWNREEVENLLIKALNHEGYNTEFGRKKDNENWIKENLK